MKYRRITNEGSLPLSLGSCLGAASPLLCLKGCYRRMESMRCPDSAFECEQQQQQPGQLLLRARPPAVTLLLLQYFPCQRHELNQGQCLSNSSHIVVIIAITVSSHSSIQASLNHAFIKDDEYCLSHPQPSLPFSLHPAPFSLLLKP